MKKVPSIGVLVIRGNEVLLVKHTESAGHLTGTYGLPAGRLEEGEKETDAALRELKEETGLTVHKDDLIPLPFVFEADILRKSGEIMHFVWQVFVAKSFEGQLKESDETIPEWVSLDQVSKLDLLPNTEEAIKKGLQLFNK